MTNNSLSALLCHGSSWLFCLQADRLGVSAVRPAPPSQVVSFPWPPRSMKSLVLQLFRAVSKGEEASRSGWCIVERYLQKQLWHFLCIDSWWMFAWCDWILMDSTVSTGTKGVLSLAIQQQHMAVPWGRGELHSNASKACLQCSEHTTSSHQVKIIQTTSNTWLNKPTRSLKALASCVNCLSCFGAQMP